MQPDCTQVCSHKSLRHLLYLCRSVRQVDDNGYESAHGDHHIDDIEHSSQVGAAMQEDTVRCCLDLEHR